MPQPPPGEARKEGCDMITDFLRVLALLATSAVTGILGAIWLFGDHTSIFVTVAVKPFAVMLLFISFVLFEQLKREVKRIDKRK